MAKAATGTTRGRPRKEKEPDAIKETPANPAALFNCKSEDIAQCSIDLDEIDRAIASLGQKKAATIGRYKNMGVPVDELREAQKIGKKDSPPAWLKRVLAVAAILKIIPTAEESDGQLTLMPGLRVAALNGATQDKLALHRAYSDGYNTGLAGGSETNNQFEAGTDLFVQWSIGNIDGQAQRAIRKPGSEKVAAADETIRPRSRRAADAEPETALERDEAAYRSGEQVHAEPDLNTEIADELATVAPMAPAETPIFS